MNKVKTEDFINYNYLGNLRISSNQKFAAFVNIQGDKEKDNYPGNIWLMDLDTKNVQQLTSGNEEKNFRWFDDDTIIFTGCRDSEVAKKNKENESWTIFYKLNIHGSEAMEWFKLPFSVGNYELLDKNHMVLSVAYRADGKNLFECADEEARKTVKAELESQKEYQWFDEIPFWANGAGITNMKRTRLYLLNLEDLSYVPISDAFANASVSHIKDGRLLYISNPMKDVRVIPSSLHLYDYKENKDTTLVEDYQVDVSWAFFIKDKIIACLSDFKEYGYHQHGTLFEVKEDKSKTKLVHFDNSYGASLGSDCIQQFGSAVKEYKDKIYFTCNDENCGCIKCFDENGKIELLSGYHGGIECFDVTENAIYFIGLQDQKLQEIYSLYNKEATQLTNFNTTMMESSTFSKIETMKFYSDGIRHEGFVIKPTDFDPNKTYPGVLEIHGGPKGTFGAVINHEMQVFANNGYFVFFCNPRGSDGRGNQFADIRGRFGKEDYDDLMTFTDEVLKQYPQLDANRLGVTGSSYGGYMSNWIITQTNRFKAAIPEASISNYVTKFLCTDIGFTYNVHNQAADPWSNIALVWEQSPLKYANQCKTPTLFIHSDQDYRCWVAEPIQMFYALKLHGCETRFLYFHGEHHGLPIFGKPSHRVKRLEAMLDWFDSHLK